MAGLDADVRADVIVSGGMTPYLPGSHAQSRTVMAAVGRAARTYAEGGFTTVVDGITRPWMLPHVLDPVSCASRSHGVVLRPSRAGALRRARARSAPWALDEAGPVTAMWDQLADLGPLERHVLDTTSQGPEETPSPRSGRTSTAGASSSPRTPVTSAGRRTAAGRLRSVRLLRATAGGPILSGTGRSAEGAT